MGAVSTFTTGNHSKPLMTDVDVIHKMIRVPLNGMNRTSTINSGTLLV